MKVLPVIYLYALGFYMLLTIPALAEPYIYALSAFIAVIVSIISLAGFSLVFFVLHLIKPGYPVVMGALALGIFLGVFVPFKILFANDDGGLFGIGDFILFPIAAVLAGWISLAVNNRKIKKQFISPLERDIEIIFSNQ